MPDWIGWLHYLSVFFYAYDITTTNEVESLRLDVTVRWPRWWASVDGRADISAQSLPAYVGAACRLRDLPAARASSSERCCAGLGRPPIPMPAA